ncbi:MAG: tetratricopeptide repeat protein, partial [Phaeodactylibacter sp.]|nr:tetratricopeptide repeat protein [Phaeodactylibacter sp.]
LRPSTDTTESKNFRFQKWQLWLLTVLVAVITLGVFFYIRSNSERASCPDFIPNSELNVLLLPYTNIGDGDYRPEIPIRDRLQKKCRENALNASVQFFDRYFDRKDAQIPSFENANRIGQGCNSELVVWGLVEKSRDQYELVTNFKYLGPSQNFNLQKIQVEGEALVDTVPSISSILMEGSITRELEDLILMLFGIVAHEKGLHQQAINSLNQVRPGKDSSELVWSQMLLADSYLEVEQNDSALMAYDKVLAAAPENPLALNNRGHLLLSKGKYAEAVNDFSGVIQQDPDAEEPRVARAVAYLKMNQKEKAMIDLDHAKRLNPQISLPKLEVGGAQLDDRMIIAIPKKSIFFQDVNYTQLYLHEDSKAVQLPARMPRGYTVVLGNTLPAGQQTAAHEISLNLSEGLYLFEIEKQGIANLNMSVEDQRTRRALPVLKELIREQLAKGSYTLQVHREQALRDLYYEIKITYLGN